jgi:hypothetical protein
MITYIWGIMVVPAFMFFRYLSIRWDTGEPDDMSQNDKVSYYSFLAFLAMSWPFVAACALGLWVHKYINGDL